MVMPHSCQCLHLEYAFSNMLELSVSPELVRQSHQISVVALLQLKYSTLTRSELYLQTFSWLFGLGHSEVCFGYNLNASAYFIWS